MRVLSCIFWANGNDSALIHWVWVWFCHLWNQVHVFARICPMNPCCFVYMYEKMLYLFTCLDGPGEDKL